MVFMSVFVALKKVTNGAARSATARKGKNPPKNQTNKKQRKKTPDVPTRQDKSFFCFNASGRAKGA